MVSAAITEEYDAAVVCSWAANAFQASAAVNIGSDPGPAYIRAELISGGSKSKYIARSLTWPD